MGGDVEDRLVPVLSHRPRDETTKEASRKVARRESDLPGRLVRMVGRDRAALAPPGSGAGACPGCGALLPAEAGPTHAYMRSSPACWARFGEILAREFSDPAYFALHQLTVDAYAVQHPGGADRRAIQSVGLHLMTLCMVLEEGADPRNGPRLHTPPSRRRATDSCTSPPGP